MEKKKVFVIMLFKDEFFEVYEMLKMQFSERFEFNNAGEEGNQQNVLKDIIQPLYEADIVIADLTGLNANVMYELSLAHSFNKKTIIITQDDLSGLPFDLKQYRAKDYTTHFKKFDELIKYLETNLCGAIDGSVSYSNPVKDFLTLQGVENPSWFEHKDAVVLEDESDKGFLDFLTDIENNAEKLTDEINSMNTDMNEMNSGTTSCTAEIERVNKNGGNGTASFVRKQTKKVAGYVETFAKKLKIHNSTIDSLWDEIEKNTLGLLENKFASKEENKESLISYLKSLYGMKEAAIGSKASISGLIDSMNGVLGIERSMNQAVRFVKEDLTTYQNITDRMCGSIDKIFEKSRFVVGTIDFTEESHAAAEEE